MSTTSFLTSSYQQLSGDSPPTFSAPPGQFVGLIAGGDYAIRNAVEGAEDSEELGATDLAELTPPLSKNDTLVGIASSGRTPYVLGSLKYARSIRATTVGLACVKPSSLRSLCDVLIECVTGPEVVTGSTRLKAGTATKMVRILYPVLSVFCPTNSSLLGRFST